MRKASKATIKATLVEFAKFRDICNSRITKLDVPGASEAFTAHLNRIESMIAEGDIHYCCQASVDSLKRDIIRAEQGYFKSMSVSGWRQIR